MAITSGPVNAANDNPAISAWACSHRVTTARTSPRSDTTPELTHRTLVRHHDQTHAEQTRPGDEFQPGDKCSASVAFGRGLTDTEQFDLALDTLEVPSAGEGPREPVGRSDRFADGFGNQNGAGPGGTGHPTGEIHRAAEPVAGSADRVSGCKSNAQLGKV